MARTAQPRAPCRLALPHLTSPYKGEGKDGHSLLVPLLCKEGQGEVEVLVNLYSPYRAWFSVPWASVRGMLESALRNWYASMMRRNSGSALRSPLLKSGWSFLAF